MIDTNRIYVYITIHNVLRLSEIRVCNYVAEKSNFEFIIGIHIKKSSLLLIMPDLYIVRVIKTRRLRWAGHVARMQEGRSAFKILTGKPTGKRPLGRPRRRWEDNIRMDLEQIGINAGNWVDSAQDRNYWRALLNAALNFRVP